MDMCVLTPKYEKYYWALFTCTADVHLPGYYAVFDADRQGEAVPEINVQMHQT
jgi:hypothetical protein